MEPQKAQAATTSHSATDYGAIVKSVRDYHATIGKQDIKWRKAQLKALKEMLEKEEAVLLEALQKDLGKGPIESHITEIGLIKSEINVALKNVGKWAKPKKVPMPLHLKPATGKTVYEPYGVALIIGAWNYPLTLTLAPLVGAIAAGNAAIIKPSEIASATAKVLEEIMPRYLDPKAFRVVQGGKEETTDLLKEQFDKIFFTGSKRVGSIIMGAAAKNVTPVTMELGGKCPAIVDSSADIDLTARRLVFGKFINAGQTCVAPDYVLVDEKTAPALTAAFKKTITAFYGEDPRHSADYSRIVNAFHHQRLVDQMSGHEIVHGGEHDAQSLYIAPTVLKVTDLNTPIMNDEVFGPLLPIVTVKNMSEAFNYIAQKDKPLALYIFAKNKKVIKQAQNMCAGAVGINEAIVHPSVAELPFGGVGGSGFGKYHGKWGFEEFSNAKAVFNGATKMDLPARYPPYKPWKQRILKFFLR